MGKRILKECTEKGKTDLVKQVLADTNKLTNLTKNTAEILIMQLNEKLNTEEKPAISISDDMLPF